MFFSQFTGGRPWQRPCSSFAPSSQADHRDWPSHRDGHRDSAFGLATGRPVVLQPSLPAFLEIVGSWELFPACAQQLYPRALCSDSCHSSPCSPKKSAACFVLENKRHQNGLSMKAWRPVLIKRISLVSMLLRLYLTSACQYVKYH